ncbi:MAG: dephospho-CoA kinase [Clostridiales bacterium]|nr:dephospho-CoA kinase [Bacillota bacterium]NLK03510.1 dephospho-CoA kinase [Clostridiales bacterium]
MKTIGITGGIGSGKSLVADIMIKKHKAYLIDTDRIAKEQMMPGGISYMGVVSYFGQDILDGEGVIDKDKLSKIVFSDKEKLLMLNSLTHPNVLHEVQREIAIKKESKAVPYCIIETALMIESGYDFLCDEVWYVHSSQETRRQRLKKHRGYTDEKIDAIFDSQSKEEDFFKNFTCVIYNNGDIDHLEQEIDKLLRG